MATIKELTCGFNLTGGNTDVGNCVFDPQVIEGAFLSYGKYLTPAEQLSLQASLEAATKAASRSGRLYPVHNFTEAEDASTERQVQTTGYGDEIVTRAKKVKERFRIYPGGKTLHAKLKVHSEVCFSAFLYDAKNRLLGWLDSDKNLRPFTFVQMYVDEPVVMTGSNAYLIPLEWAYANNGELLQSFAWLNADSDNFLLSEIKGLKDVELVEKVAVSAGGVITLNGFVGSTRENMRTLYGSSLVNDEAFVCTNETSGAIVTTTVADDAGDDGYAVTLDNAAWTAAASGTRFSLKLAAVSVLQSAPVSLPSTVKIESDKLYFEKP